MKPWVYYVLAATLVTTGCTAMGTAMTQLAGMGVIREEVSDFDGRKIIEVSGNNVAGAFAAQIGARWESTEPDNVFLTLTYASDVRSGNAYTNFRELAVNIDGEISTFPVTAGTAHESSTYNTVSQTIYTTSVSGLTIPLDYLERMLTAQTSKVRIVTTDGYSEGDFALAHNAGAPMAKASLQQFYDRVLAYKDSAAGQ